MEKFHKNKKYYKNIRWTANQAKEEIAAGIKLLNKIDKPIIAFAGSARVKKNSAEYKHCYELAYELGKNGYAIVSGGGPGIMHAANSGAYAAPTESIGLKADLLTKEKIKEKIYTKQLNFHYFFARRFTMLMKTQAMIFYPGGYGTMNELLENAMLIQNSVMDEIPLICVGKKYWSGLINWIKNDATKQKYVSPFDYKIIKLADTKKDVIKILNKYASSNN